MIFLTWKLPRPRFLAGAMAALCLMIAAVPLSPSPPETSPAGVVLPTGSGLRTNGDRVELLTALGWSVWEEPLTTETLLIPAELPDSEFLTLQREQGFDLSALSGQRVRRYIYRLKDDAEGRAALLVFRHRLVGGAVYTLSPGSSPAPLLPTD